MHKGAHFLKMYTSGAVSGVYDPLDISEFSFDEIKAAADEAKRWNIYLAVHVHDRELLAKGEVFEGQIGAEPESNSPETG